MTELMKIKEFVQSYVKAISEILEAVVTVVDSNCERVAGTGEYSDTSEKHISHGSFFNKVIQTKKISVIKNVREELGCKDCAHVLVCEELANVGYPIFLNEEVVGVIGIIAFDEATRERLLAKQTQIENFLEYMSQLLESKIKSSLTPKKIYAKKKEIISAQSITEYIGNSEKSLNLISLIEKIGNFNSTVLLSGETGTGKKEIAKIIHSLSIRKNNAMISFDCGAVSKESIEKELFGEESPIGVLNEPQITIGKIEMANHGTIFLESIEEMPYHVQKKLTRVLRENNVERFGGNRIPIDVRFICATSKDLWQEVLDEKFSKELYFELNVITLEIEPLRERKEDVIFFSNKFLAEYKELFEKDIKGISSEALRLLTEYSWPGNVRELKSVIEYATNLSSSLYISELDLPKQLRNKFTGIDIEKTLTEILNSYEREILKNLLMDADSLQKKDMLAKKLGVSRATLYRKIAEYGL